MNYVGSMGAVYKQMGEQDKVEEKSSMKTGIKKKMGGWFGFGTKEKSSAGP